MTVTIKLTEEGAKHHGKATIEATEVSEVHQNYNHGRGDRLVTAIERETDGFLIFTDHIAEMEIEA
jgi:hypothetical protein